MNQDILKISFLDLQGEGVRVCISVAADLLTYEDRMIDTPKIFGCYSANPKAASLHPP